MRLLRCLLLANVQCIYIYIYVCVSAACARGGSIWQLSEPLIYMRMILYIRFGWGKGSLARMKMREVSSIRFGDDHSFVVLDYMNECALLNRYLMVAFDIHTFNI